jgi:hypothetical protein
MRRGFRALSLLVQETLKRDPHGGDLYVFSRPLKKAADEAERI